LLLAYVKEQAKQVAEMGLGWAADHVEAGKGVRVNLIGFACTNDQKTPIVARYSEEMNGGPITSLATLSQLLTEIGNTVTPDGGTCPGMAIEENVMYVEMAPVSLYKEQATIFVSDGVVYDTPHPLSAKDGLEDYGVLRFALALDPPTPNLGDFTFEEAWAIRNSTMHGFVAPEYPGNFYDLAGVNYGGLADLADDIAYKISLGAFPANPPIKRYTWCLWRRLTNCKSSAWRQGNCQWPNLGKVQWGCKKK